MPTERQIKDSNAVVTSLYPDARIKRLGPEGIEYEYPDRVEQAPEWIDVPFSGDSGDK